MVYWYRICVFVPKFNYRSDRQNSANIWILVISTIEMFKIASKESVNNIR